MVSSSHEHDQARSRSGSREVSESGEAHGTREAREARGTREARDVREQPGEARVIALRPDARAPGGDADEPEAREPLWRHLVGGVLRRERVAQQRTLKDVADAARISMPYLSEVERGRKEASSEVLAAAAHALGLGLGDVLTRVQSDLARPVRTVRPLHGPDGTRGTGAHRSVGARPSAPRQGDVRLAA